ncbi:hypothetical protein PanWU01x14_361300 [Parasponia andersonii]|uniref:Uncharacterized protein n=1 Tax=Parasponia andersonii TaxID=3476 RepID=A0A2P5A7E6_PARAD|nr:hypothetical protein PanWU01x14_361300 [Parasponia andersonii]
MYLTRPLQMILGSDSPTSTSSTYRESASSCLQAFRMRPTLMSSISAASLIEDEEDEEAGAAATEAAAAAEAAASSSLAVQNVIPLGLGLGLELVLVDEREKKNVPSLREAM